MFLDGKFTKFNLKLGFSFFKHPKAIVKDKKLDKVSNHTLVIFVKIYF